MEFHWASVFFASPWALCSVGNISKKDASEVEAQFPAPSFSTSRNLLGKQQAIALDPGAGLVSFKLHFIPLKKHISGMVYGDGVAETTNK